MSDDAGSLDVAVAGKHWYVEGGGGRRFATKGEAIAYAWTLTIPGGVRPSVKTRGDTPVVARTEPTPPQREVKITVDSDDDDEVVWGMDGDIVTSRWRSSTPTATIELTIPFTQGATQEMMMETVRNALHGEARARGLELISDASLEMFTDGMESNVKIRATARARARE